MIPKSRDAQFCIIYTLCNIRCQDLFHPSLQSFSAGVLENGAEKSFPRIKIVSLETRVRLNEILFDNLPDMYENASAKGIPSFALKNGCVYPSED